MSLVLTSTCSPKVRVRIREDNARHLESVLGDHRMGDHGKSGDHIGGIEG